MTFNVPSFFVGIGTVLGILTVGFGGGVMMSGVITEKGPREPSKVERRATEVARPPIAAATPVPVRPAPDAQPAAPAPRSAEFLPAAAPPQPDIQAQPKDPPPPDPQPTALPPITAQTPPLGPRQPVALVNPVQEPRRVLPDAHVKAQEAKRVAAEQKKAEQKKKVEQRKLAERRRQQQIKDAEMRAAAARSRQEDLDDDEREERPVFLQRERGGLFRTPGFRLFGNDDD